MNQLIRKTKLSSSESNGNTKRIAIESPDLIKCNIYGCTETFSSIADRNWHVFNNPHGRHESTCTHCDLLKYSITEEQYLEHLETHKKFKCDLCSNKFTSDTALFKHCTESHIKNFKCNTCKKMFWTQEGLKLHITTKHSVPTFKCRECPKILTSENFRDRHEQSMHGIDDAFIRKINNDRPFKCDECENTFTTHNGRKHHIHAVHDRITYDCEICDIKYTTKWYLNKHLQNVHGNYNFICDICNMRFAAQSSLKRHMKKLHNQDIGVI